MKLTTLLVTALTIVSGAFAVDVQKSVIVSYPADTPNSVLDQAKDAIKESGGIITHEYQLIKGFAATVGEKVLENIAAWGAPYQALIEEDQVVSAL
ncbi:endopeptidase inhibitor-like protein [Coniochaeta sp. PMI_546]|nr:endopeptidase inhibitor-like protein [Coniochaeta sp. PMI_546]